MKDNLFNIWHTHDGKGMPIYLSNDPFEVELRDGTQLKNHFEGWNWSTEGVYNPKDVYAWRYVKPESWSKTGPITAEDFGIAGIGVYGKDWDVNSIAFKEMPKEEPSVIDIKSSNYTVPVDAKGWHINTAGFVMGIETAQVQPNKYQRIIRGKDQNGNVVKCIVDVYDVLTAWETQNPALQHLIKKALQPGERDHKSLVQDLEDIIASAQRALELAKGDM